MPTDTLAPVDALNRTPISNWMKAKIESELNGIADDKRGALIIMADDHGTTAHLAARLSDGWKVAGEIGWEWSEKRPSGFVAIERAW